LAEDSFSLHREQWEKMGKPYPVMLQGDSREFSSLIREAAHAIITSPPYSEQPIAAYDSGSQGSKWRETGLTPRQRSGGKLPSEQYGTTEGQIGAMKEGKLDEVVAVITSPPYSVSATGHKPGTGHDTTESRIKRLRAAGYDPDRLLTPGRRAHGNLGDMEHYPQSEGQLGGMPEGDHGEVVDGIITSPPYAQTEVMNPKLANMGSGTEEHRQYRNIHGRQYSKDAANMGNLPEGSHEAVVDAVVTSPPYEEGGGHGGNTDRDILKAKSIYMPCDEYGDTEGNIGNQRGGTYWQAVSEVCQECLKALKPGGVMAVVVKSFVRNKQIVDLPSQTLGLLEAIGFEPLERIRAWMTSPATQKSLMPDIRPDYTKKRASFFRRLYERKYPENRIDFEEVLIVRKQVPT